MKQKAHFHRVVWTLGRKLWAVFEVSPAPVSSSHSLRVNYRLRAALRGAITGKHTVLILDCRTAMWLMISCFESRQQRRMWGSLCRVPFTSLGWAFFGPEREKCSQCVCLHALLFRVCLCFHCFFRGHATHKQFWGIVTQYNKGWPAFICDSVGCVSYEIRGPVLFKDWIDLNWCCTIWYSVMIHCKMSVYRFKTCSFFPFFFPGSRTDWL